jgi:hypothetical protein
MCVYVRCVCVVCGVCVCVCVCGVWCVCVCGVCGVCVCPSYKSYKIGPERKCAVALQAAREVSTWQTVHYTCKRDKLYA